MIPGIHTISNDEYHAGSGISKTGLWTIHKRTPFHFKFQKRVETNAQAFGSGAHCAVLEPNLFEARYMRGPSDRRGNKWGAAQEIAAARGAEALTEADYDYALRLRDVLQRDPLVQKLTAGTPAIEQSAYWIDAETGELCRCRPDIYNHDLKVMADLKSTTDAGADQWVRRVVDYGYHVQEPWYAEGWMKAGGGAVDAFVFLTIEKEPPFAYAIYELGPRAIAEGAVIIRRALETYHSCMQSGQWPGYGSGVTPLDLPNWAYRFTKQEEE